MDLRLNEEELRQDPESVFSILGKLGEGSYGSVFKAIHKKSSQVVALKIVPVDNDIDDIIKEINVMNGCDCNSIVRYYGSYFKNDSLWMFIEYCAAGSVSDIMKVCKTVIAEKEIAVICRSALEGLKYLHDRRKIHRDIKAGNILLGKDCVAKLADFGVAGQLTDTAAKRNTVIGTPFWMAPEIIQEVGYGTTADIWSLGITCIEMAEGRPPYHDIHPMRAIFMIPSRPPPTLAKPELYSDEFHQFLALCLTKDPTQRPSALALLDTPFIKSAPGTSFLQDKVLSAIDLIANGALQQSSEDISDSESGSDLEIAAATMRPAAKKVLSDKPPPETKEIEEQLGTMLIMDSNTNTIKPTNRQIEPSSHAFNQPSTISTMRKEPKMMTDGPRATQEVATSESTDDTTTKTTIDLQALLQSLEWNMEVEIMQIKAKYEKKRAPILEALQAKK